MVIYGSSNPSGELRRYGGTTDNSDGYLIGQITNFTYPNSTKPLDTLYPTNTTDGNAGQGGDSGGPIYIGMNVTISGKKIIKH
jgi:hypothetical protein